jgi:hypothetical protein
MSIPIEHTSEAEELCPTTGRPCRKAACERGGCQKARSKQPKPAAVANEAANPETGKLVQVTAELAAERAALREARAEIDALHAAIGPLLEEAIEAFEQTDVALTFMQQSLGFSSSPRLTAIRETKAKMRSLLKIHQRTPEPAAAE